MDVFDLEAVLKLNKTGFESDLDNAESKMSGIGGKIAKGIGSGVATAAKVGAVAIGAAVTAVGAFGTASVNTGKEFDSSMSQVAATMGKTVDEIQDLRNFAQDMGAKTAFSATQAADALNYMALAGYDADKSMKMLPNVLNLAAAGGIELATASDMVTDAQSALGLNLDETSEMVDKMAKASSKSNTSVAQLGEAFLTVGGTAKMLKGGTTELSTALGIIADNGVKGAEGGTALRNILLSLSAPTDKAAKALDKLGVSAFDDQGNMRDLSDVFKDFNTALAPLSSQERTETLNKIFNKVDLKSVNALLDTNVDRWEELTKAIDDSSGAAEKMANTQLDNLAGDITLLQSAMEGAKIVVSDKLTPSFREFVQFGTSSIGTLTDAFKEGGLSGAMEALGTVISDGLNMIIEKAPQFIDAGIQLLESLGKGLIDNLPVIIDAALQIIMQLTQALIDNLPAVIDAGLKIILELAIGIGKALPELVPSIVDVVINIVDTLIDNVDLLIDAAIAIILGLTDGIINSLPRLIERLPEIIIKIIDALVKNAPKLIEASIQIIVSLAKGLITNIPKLVAVIPQIIVAVVNGFKNLMSSYINIGSSIVEGIKNGLVGAWGRIVDWIRGKASELVSTVKSFFGIHSPSTVFRDQVGKNLALGIGEGFSDSIDDVKDDMIDALDFDFPSIDAPDIISDGLTQKVSVSNDVQASNVDKIIALLNNYLPQLANMQIVLDGNVVAGYVDDKMSEYSTRRVRFV